ncbi:MAG: hypothetical protein AAFQ94_13530 [Bacteroidota bacterium]
MSHPKVNIPYLYQNPQNSSGDENGNFNLDIVIYLESNTFIEEVKSKKSENGHTYIVKVRIKEGGGSDAGYEYLQHFIPVNTCRKLKVEVVGSIDTRPIGKNTIAIRDFNEDDDTDKQS